MEWNRFKALLVDTFVQGELDSKAIQHLEFAYDRIEHMWDVFNKDVEIERVIIGEATLFKRGSYIYNIDTPNSSFLRPSDFPGGQNGSKEYLLSLLKKHGIAIVDSYPFAFNDVDTPTVTYSSKLKSKHYLAFLQSSFNLYGAEKIKRILSKNPKAKVAFRYRRNDNLLGHGLDVILKKHSLTASRHHCLFGNISIDRAKLHDFLG
jgi:hypothetical protein